ncbi:MAG: hypothetical protein IKE52_02540 [Mogibacterium sp.]|nr:hypothetical protein [Mogibacterium sp.]
MKIEATVKEIADLIRELQGQRRTDKEIADITARSIVSEFQKENQHLESTKSFSVRIPSNIDSAEAVRALKNQMKYLQEILSARQSASKEHQQ